MHPRAVLVPADVVLALAALLLLCGCVSHEDTSADVSRSRATPSTGAAVPDPQRPPTAPMNAFEKQVAGQLTARLARSGLHLDYLDCPHWSRHVPARMSCRGYVDGLVSAVFVRLRAMSGTGVGLDAWLADSVMATRDLELTVRRLGWSSADCGTAAAYPATVGTRITCRVTRRHRTSFVVATVRSRTGRVTVAPYAAAR